MPDEVKAGNPAKDAVFEVDLDGGELEPERTGVVTVHAKDAAHAKAFAAQQNPGLSASNARKLN